MEKVFAYPLTSAPLSLVHVDKIINKTDKAKVLYIRENMITSTAPSQKVNITLVDGMFALHILQNLSNTFREVSRVILCKLCEISERVDMLCDRPTYGSHSVKGVEHTRRSDKTSHTITRPEQQRPKDWQ